MMKAFSLPPQLVAAMKSLTLAGCRSPCSLSSLPGSLF